MATSSCDQAPTGSGCRFGPSWWTGRQGPASSWSSSTWRKPFFGGYKFRVDQDKKQVQVMGPRTAEAEIEEILNRHSPTDIHTG
jgi:hypothetical protein